MGVELTLVPEAIASLRDKRPTASAWIETKALAGVHAQPPRRWDKRTRERFRINLTPEARKVLIESGNASAQVEEWLERE